MSGLLLAIPILIGFSAVTVLAHRVYMACIYKPATQEVSDVTNQFSTSLDTTSSFEDVKFTDATKPVSASWNPFQKYANVAKNEAVDPYLEDMEARFEVQKLGKPVALMTPVVVSTPKKEPLPLRSPKPVHDFSRIGNYPESMMATNHIGVSVRV